MMSDMQAKRFLLSWDIEMSITALDHQGQPDSPRLASVHPRQASKHDVILIYAQSISPAQSCLSHPVMWWQRVMPGLDSNAAGDSEQLDVRRCKATEGKGNATETPISGSMYERRENVSKYS